MTTGPLPKSIASVSLSGTLAEKLEAAAAIGFDGVEIFEADLLSFDGSPQDVRYLAESLGLTIICFQPFRDFDVAVGQRDIAAATQPADGEICDAGGKGQSAARHGNGGAARGGGVAQFERAGAERQSAREGVGR